MDNYIQIKKSYLLYFSLLVTMVFLVAFTNTKERAHRVNVEYETDYINGMQYRIYQSTDSGDIDIVNVTRDKAETEYYDQKME